MLVYLFAISVLLTLIVYLLRGMGILGFLPGYVLLILIALGSLTGIAYIIQKNWRF